MAGQKHDVTPETWDSMIPHFLQNVSLAGRKTLHDATRPSQPMSQFFSLGVGEMERWTLQFLSSLANSPGWENTVSLVNEHHQTLAHLAVLFRYTTLLKTVAQWGIDVDVQDVNGFTALHCAYLCGDLDSVRVLKGYGADEDIQDNLGRRPSDMYIQTTNDLGEESPLSDRTSSSAELSSAWEEEKFSMAHSHPGSFSDNETMMDLPASRHEQPHTRESTASSRIMAASISMPSLVCSNSFATDQGGWIDGVSELNPSDSSVSLEHSPSHHVHNVQVTTLRYARSHGQEPKDLEMFHESKWHHNQITQLASWQQAIYKSPRNSQNTGSDVGSPGEYGLMKNPSIDHDSRITSAFQ